MVTVDHEAAVKLALCKPDYEEMTERFPEIMGILEAALDNAIALETVQDWIEKNTTDAALRQQLIKAARWYGSTVDANGR